MYYGIKPETKICELQKISSEDKTVGIKVDKMVTRIQTSQKNGDFLIILKSLMSSGKKGRKKGGRGKK
jgi:hypothetical protein